MRIIRDTVAIDLKNVITVSNHEGHVSITCTKMSAMECKLLNGPQFVDGDFLKISESVLTKQSFLVI